VKDLLLAFPWCVKRKSASEWVGIPF
jgi:hypothetical protein